MKILIVEDDFVSRNILNRMLIPFGDCDLAANGKEGLEAFRQALDDWKPYNLVCLDIMMPEMDGHTVLQKIRAIEESHKVGKPNRAKVIMTSASSDKADVINAVKAECDGYLVKPVIRQKLMDKLKELGLLTEEDLRSHI